MKANQLFLLTGMILLLIFGVRCFGIFDSIIKTDKQFISLLIGGMLFSMIGFHLEARGIEPKSRYQQRNKEAQEKSSGYALLCCTILLFLLIIL